MADDVVIRAESLGKKYTIGHQADREKYTALRDVIARQVNTMFNSTRDLLNGRSLVAGDEKEDFWALKNVNFEINRGELVGIIGRNGAGKSTLLKILSRITEPSEGRVVIEGRVASLLEVGTGFHPELTGRENIFLNGAILGMTHAEIKNKFHEIVDFAEVEKFLDTPVKRYSSGMHVRLAFAVAAHLEPEILVVDEVLAVGDADFQKKCLGKMRDVAGHGRTVLFVSHNMAAIAQLTNRGILLQNGTLIFDGTIQTSINEYNKNYNNKETKYQVTPSLEFTICEVLEESSFIAINIRIVSSEIQQLDHLCVFINNIHGTRIAIADLRHSLKLPRKLSRGRFSIDVKMNGIKLVEGVYDIGLYLGSEEFDGNLFSVAQLNASPKGVSMYPAEHRGFFEPSVTATVCEI